MVEYLPHVKKNKRKWKLNPIGRLYLAQFIFPFPNFNLYKGQAICFLCSLYSISFSRVLNQSTANPNNNNHNDALIQMKLIKFHDFFFNLHKQLKWPLKSQDRGSPSEGQGDKCQGEARWKMGIHGLNLQRGLEFSKASKTSRELEGRLSYDWSKESIFIPERLNLLYIFF